VDEEKTYKVTNWVHRFLFNPSWQYRTLINAAKNGYILSKIDEKTYSYTQSDIVEPDYFIDFYQSDNDPDKNQFIKSRTELGWQYLGTCSDWHYFIARRSKKNKKLYSDCRPYINKLYKLFVIYIFTSLTLLLLV
jgi:hypothetical protein